MTIRYSVIIRSTLFKRFKFLITCSRLSLFFSSRRRHTISRTVSWGRITQQQTKIFVPTVFGKRLCAVGHRGRNGVFWSNDSCNNLHSFRIFGHKNRDKRKNPIQKLPCDGNHRNRRDSERDKFCGCKRRDSADGVAASFCQRGRQQSCRVYDVFGRALSLCRPFTKNLAPTVI